MNIGLLFHSRFLFERFPTIAEYQDAAGTGGLEVMIPLGCCSSTECMYIGQNDQALRSSPFGSDFSTNTEAALLRNALRLRRRQSDRIFRFLIVRFHRRASALGQLYEHCPTADTVRTELQPSRWLGRSSVERANLFAST